eukprot:TRINITY_DN4143_c0_g1_i1.p1 TRINITY_DN4143_c0_g1~~TRINITY_DN4143_c0_g1_i1.p1  ORF type:complete len:462 (+),score=50.76 TRINITY_DN4143_c0_g1_i1:204-1589(+)
MGNCWTSAYTPPVTPQDPSPVDSPRPPTNGQERNNIYKGGRFIPPTANPSSTLRVFSFQDLKAATRNFRPDSLLGEGGFGGVFKGWIDEHGTMAVRPGTGMTVAVKQLNQDGLQGHQEWLGEGHILGGLHHPNLVKLIGYCSEQDHRLLVYEFMPRGSLENHLFRRKGTTPTLPWLIRMKIALGAAQGVAFLHMSTPERKQVIYRDFKTSNILLDSDYTAKLSDFGLAKDGPEGDRTHVSTRVMGTHGYAAPEYVMTGHLTPMSDVYSFGVVLLEMITGRLSIDRNRPTGEHNLVEWARPYLKAEKRKLMKLIDPRLESLYSMKGAQKAAALALRCLSLDPKARPTMSEVVDLLKPIQEMKHDLAAQHGHPPSSASGVPSEHRHRQVPSPSPNGNGFVHHQVNGMGGHHHNGVANHQLNGGGVHHHYRYHSSHHSPMRNGTARAPHGGSQLATYAEQSPRR